DVDAEGVVVGGEAADLTGDVQRRYHQGAFRDHVEQPGARLADAHFGESQVDLVVTGRQPVEAVLRRVDPLRLVQRIVVGPGDRPGGAGGPRRPVGVSEAAGRVLPVRRPQVTGEIGVVTATRVHRLVVRRHRQGDRHLEPRVTRVVADDDDPRPVDTGCQAGGVDRDPDLLRGARGEGAAGRVFGQPRQVHDGFERVGVGHAVGQDASGVLAELEAELHRLAYREYPAGPEVVLGEGG